MPSWPNSRLHPLSVGLTPPHKIPSPPRRRPASKALRRNRGAKTVHGTPWGHRKQRPKRERPFSFVWVTHPPALPGRRVLHFELPAVGPESGHLSAHATGAERAGLAARGGDRISRREAGHQSRPAHSTSLPRVRLGGHGSWAPLPRLVVHVRRDERASPPPSAPRGGPTPQEPEDRGRPTRLRS